MQNTPIINVLHPDVYQDCHIKGTINVPLDQLAEYVKQFPKDTELIVYCAHYTCPLSHEAWHLLHDLGYTNVYAYEGGNAEWYQKKLPTEGACMLPYLHEKHVQPSKKDPLIKTISAEELIKKLKLD